MANGMRRYRIYGGYVGAWSVEVEAPDEATAIVEASGEAVADPAGLDVNVFEIEDIDDAETADL